MHARTWGRLWPICQINTSGKFYLTRHRVQTWVHQTWLIPQVEEPMRGRFRSLEDVSIAVTRAVRGLKKCGTLDGIANFPKRWDAVIEKQGDYTEGL
jgi:hypothetical protein